MITTNPQLSSGSLQTAPFCWPITYRHLQHSSFVSLLLSRRFVPESELLKQALKAIRPLFYGASNAFSVGPVTYCLFPWSLHDHLEICLQAHETALSLQSADLSVDCALLQVEDNPKGLRARAWKPPWPKIVLIL